MWRLRRSFVPSGVVGRELEGTVKSESFAISAEAWPSIAPDLPNPTLDTSFLGAGGGGRRIAHGQQQTSRRDDETTTAGVG